jgi:hypothetical protein
MTGQQRLDNIINWLESDPDFGTARTISLCEDDAANFPKDKILRKGKYTYYRGIPIVQSKKRSHIIIELP